MMSGLASGLRIIDWKMAPDSPKQAPTAIPVTARGSRSSCTMKSVARVPRPVIDSDTCLTEIGKSPTVMARQNMISRKITRPTTTTAVRWCRLVRTARTMSTPVVSAAPRTARRLGRTAVTGGASRNCGAARRTSVEQT